ncbi:ABC transporter substrate-binding protein [Thermoanaerobacterium sp. RBIITD]|uniref:ABC transporter substrate-binding protein n=1 Tax=Thermoanaerobacterium sp. RBIITD TaxID=1550240 RepID=UPI000BB694B0|nr:ABC transporter substrate-binding protein [Thermoanaerobacterium sp. RBIITD]SNX54281.1 NitT/TauT family transport system substrate-binding protein [Thermoanaerobacterium sp. RBIITD]
MKKSIIVISILLIISLLLTSCNSSKSTASNQGDKNKDIVVKIGVSSWVGFAPLYVASEKGIFKKDGVNVKLETIQSATDRRTAMAANKIQGFVTTVDTHVMTAAAGIPVEQVLALDTSFGGDGVVAKKSIKTFADLKGKSVAIDMSGGASYFWFLYLLDKNGMKLKDVKAINMSAGDAGSAFVSGKVDAAVTWQPWLTKAEQTDFGHVLISSKETPGLIVDSLGFRKDFIKNHPDLVQNIVNGWFDALDFIKNHPKEGNQIMAKAMNQSVKDFENTLPDVEFYDKKKNEEYFGTKENPGLIRKVTSKAIDFWYKEKLINNRPETEALINDSFVNSKK